MDDLAGGPSWSPDGKWITYEKRRVNRFGVIWVYSVEDGSKHQITDGMSDAAEPVFDADGKYLFFRASTNSGMTKSGLDMTSNDHPVTYDIYITVLRNDLPSPFQPESDDEEVKAEEATDEGSRAEAEEEEPFRIDFENIGQRILALPVGDGSYNQSELHRGREAVLPLRILGHEVRFRRAGSRTRSCPGSRLSAFPLTARTCSTAPAGTGGS